MRAPDLPGSRPGRSPQLAPKSTLGAPLGIRLGARLGGFPPLQIILPMAGISLCHYSETTPYSSMNETRKIHCGSCRDISIEDSSICYGCGYTACTLRPMRRRPLLLCIHQLLLIQRPTQIFLFSAPAKLARSF